jgi:DNA-binding transcriptional LysR family regulator
MLDFRLRVFYTVARQLNFTKAAATLHITQPAVTRHIKELEQNYKTTLFDRQNSGITLTEAGHIMLQYATTIMEQYEMLDFDINSLNNQVTGDLRIGASTTIGQYVLPPVLASFHERYPDVQIHLANENSNRILQLLLQKDIDIALVEGKTNNNSVQFMPYLDDEIVLVCNRTNTRAGRKEMMLQELTKLPLVMREGDSGTYEIIEEQLSTIGLPMTALNIKMRLAGTESIKRFVEQSDHFAFLSTHAIADELAQNRLRIVDIKQLRINRVFHIALRQGQPLPVVTPLLEFLKRQMATSIVA